jgi:hypothetical protein
MKKISITKAGTDRKNWWQNAEKVASPLLFVANDTEKRLHDSFF